MPPRGGARAQTTARKTTKTKATKASTTTKASASRGATSSRGRGGKAKGGVARGDDEDDELTRLQNETGPIIMDDDEEDEMALRSPVKPGAESPPPPPRAKEPAAKGRKPKTARAKAPAKSVLGNARHANVDSSGVSPSDHASEAEWDEMPEEDEAGAEQVEKEGSSRGVNGRAGRGRSKATSATSRAKQKVKKPAALIDSSDDEAEEDSRVFAPQAASEENMSMPEEQIQTFLNGYDLEASNRLSKIRTHLEITLESARSQMSILLSRLPLAARQLPLDEFIERYSADVQGVVHRVQGQEASDIDGWEEMKKKRTREREQEEESEKEKDKSHKGKAARRGNAAATSPAKTKAAAPSVVRGAARGRGRPLKTSTTSRSDPPTRANSTTTAPSTATFSPRLATAPASLPISASSALKTPAKGAKAGRPSRAANVGEVIKYMSLNGSPITGVIGPDGRLRQFTEADDAEDDDEEEAEGGEELGSAREKPVSNGASAKAAPLANGKQPAMPPALGTRTGAPQPPSSPAPARSRTGTSGAYGFNSSSAIMFDDESSPVRSAASRPQGGADDSNELPDEEAYMRRIMAEEAARRREASATASASRLKPKSSAARLLGGRSGGPGGSSAAPSSSSMPPSSAPPSSPGPTSSSFGMRSLAAGTGLRSSSPTKGPSTPSRAKTLSRPFASKTASNTPQAEGRRQQRLSLVNARGETVDLASVKEDDITSDQKAHLWRLFGRLGMGGSPKKK